MNEMALMTNKYGQKIWSETDSHIAEAILNKGVYDENAVYYIEKILTAMPERPVVLDIGAHIGNHAIVMTQFSKMVYCFEPMPENVEVLQRNQRENHIENMQIFNVGLSDQNENLKFYNDGSTFVAGLQRAGSATNMLDCRIGDEILKLHDVRKVDFIKIDIEGFEARALYGLRQTILASRPVIIMEWNNDSTREQFKKYELFDSVFKNYHVRAISHNHHKFYWGNKWYSQMLRFIHRKFTSKRRCLTNFLPEADYTNVLLIPDEKRWVVEF